MGKHESIEIEANSATEVRLSPSPVSPMDPAATPKMALADFDAQCAVPRIESEHPGARPIETSKIEPEQIELAGIDARDVIQQIEGVGLSDPQPRIAGSESDQSKVSPPVGSARPRSDRFNALAASLALAAALGGMAGALAAYSLAPSGPPPAMVTGKSVIEEIHALKENVVQARVELAALKVSLDAFNRTANAQFTKIGERIERIDRNQTEPAAKLNKAIETLERMSRAEITGTASSTANGGEPGQTAKPSVLEGWLVRDVHRGTALIEGRSGMIEVDQGDVVPGLGRVEAIRKQEGRWVVVTSKGTILSPR